MKIIKNIISISIVIGMFFFVSACQDNTISDEGSDTVGKDSKEYVFDYIKDNEEELNQIITMIKQYPFDFWVLEKDGMALVCSDRANDDQKAEIQNDEKLMKLIERILDDGIIHSINANSGKETTLTYSLDLDDLLMPSGTMFRWLKYSEDDLTIERYEKVTEYWYYKEAYGT